ncbi:helix-turn-helix transcriptional regulator [Staphylococcus argenteus]|uniref:helix-turn-helix domain-containing protein n=1 Tax=Staphylococcus argenteus TaxID=985002 RepID=UPI001FBAC965|nr:AraC family transcriptional regulator [Staphylococcus argenteus]GJF57556.1 helix-turn-helix transcriptional regulator [Staphylococcus argenteus]
MTDNFSLHILKNMKVGNAKEANLKIVYWLQGTGVITINLQRYEVRANDVTIIMLNDLYQIESHEESVCCVVEISAKTYLRFMSTNCRVRGQLLSNDIGGTFRILLKYLIHNQVEQQVNITNDKLISYICVELMSLNTNDDRRHIVAEEVHEYLTHNHHKKINRKDVINHVNITSKALSEMFKVTPYSNFVQYLNHIRLEHCLIDILTSMKPIEEIASNHSFNHYSRFIHLFKETYGDTPKLIRKTYRPTSHSINHSQIVDIDENIIKLIDESINDMTKVKEIQVPWEAIDNPKNYKPKNIYIKGNSFYWIDYYMIEQMILRLRVNPENLYIILTIDVSKDELSTEQIKLLLQKFINYSVNVVSKIKHEYDELLTSSERARLEILVATIFNMTFERNRSKIAFIIYDLKVRAIQKVKKLISNYIQEFELIYILDQNEVDTQYDVVIDFLIDRFVVTLGQFEQISVSSSKLICDFDFINRNTYSKEIITLSDIRLMSQLMENYSNYNGLCIQMSMVYEVINEISLTKLSMLIFIINILNQLRGVVIYQNDTMIVTKFKHEIQCVICFPAALLNEKSGSTRIICKGLKQFSHAETKQIVLSIDKDKHTSENGVFVNDIMQQHKFWKANFIEKNIYDHSLMVSSNSIVHLKYHLEI